MIDRSVCFGWNCGHNFIELKALLSDLEAPAPLLLDFIGGIGGCDITAHHVERVIDSTVGCSGRKETADRDLAVVGIRPPHVVSCSWSVAILRKIIDES